MSRSLPERPDLDQLRRQAKELRDAARQGDPGAVERFARHHPSAALGLVTLAGAQLVVARELGFHSWPQLKATIDASATSPQHRAEAFVAASIDGRVHEAESILDADPDIARYSLAAAAVLGDSEHVGKRLALDPPAAAAIDEVRGWPPLLYACYSHWHRIDPGRAAGMAQVVRLLLDAGASPNTNNGARAHRGYRSALHGSAMVNNPAILRVLLEHGANPNDGESLYHAAGHRDHACLELMLSHGARVAGTWALDVAVHADDPNAVSLLMRAAQRDGEPAPQLATSVLADAAATASSDVLDALLRAGGDPTARDDAGRSAVRLAVRAGRPGSATLLASAGASDDSTEVDRFIGACMRADRSTAERLLARYPDLRGGLTDDDRAAVVEAAGSGTADAVALMLGLGFSPHARNNLGEQPLHTAAYAGHADAVRLLLEAGADVEARDDNFDGTPLAYATVGSGERAGQLGDWIETVRLLVEAGASRDGVWISGKPPSEAVVGLLRGYGITPDDDPEPQQDDHVGLSPSAGIGVMADVARHLEVAYRHRNLELLESLLHPEVQWTGVCSNRAEVLDWCRGLLVDGINAAVESVEVHGDAVVLGLSVARQSEGARPAAPELLYQVFTVEDAQIIDIRVYPNRASALTHPVS